MDLLLNREIVHHSRPVLTIFQHICYSQPFILGDSNMLDLLTLDVLLGPRSHIPQVPDSDMLRLGQVISAFRR